MESEEKNTKSAVRKRVKEEEGRDTDSAAEEVSKEGSGLKRGASKRGGDVSGFAVVFVCGSVCV